MEATERLACSILPLFCICDQVDARPRIRLTEKYARKKSSPSSFLSSSWGRTDYHRADPRHTNDCDIIVYARIALSRSAYELVLDSLECNENRMTSAVHSASAIKYQIGSDKRAENWLRGICSAAIRETEKEGKDTRGSYKVPWCHAANKMAEKEGRKEKKQKMRRKRGAVKM